MRRLVTLVFSVSVMFSIVPDVALALTDEEKIAMARSAGPNFISDTATVVEETGKVMFQGSNGWTCNPGMPPKYENPMCNDAIWQKLMAALNAKKPFSTDTSGFHTCFGATCLSTMTTPTMWINQQALGLKRVLT